MLFHYITVLNKEHLTLDRKLLKSTIFEASLTLSIKLMQLASKKFGQWTRPNINQAKSYIQSDIHSTKIPMGVHSSTIWKTIW